MVINLWWTWWNRWWWFRVENIWHEVISNNVIIIHFRIRFVLRRKNFSLFRNCVSWSGVGLLPGSSSWSISTPISGFTGLKPGVSCSILFFFDFVSYLRGLNRSFQVQGSAPSFQVLIGICFCSSLLFRWLFTFGELNGVFVDDFESKMFEMNSSAMSSS